MKPSLIERIKRAWHFAKPVLSVAVSIGLLIFIFSQVQWPELWDSLRDLRFQELLLALLLMIGSDLCFAVKSWFLRPEMPLYRLVSASLTSKFFALLPGGNITGETVRLLKLREMMGFQSATSLLIIDKQSHMIPAMVLCFVGLLRPSVAIPGIFYVLAVVAALWPVLFPGPIFVPPIRRWLLTHGKKLLRFRWGKPVYEQIEMLSDACQTLMEKPRSLILHLLCGFLGELCTILMMVLLAGRLEFPVPAWDFLWLNGFMLMAMIIPFSVMGMGVREGAMVFFFSWFGMDVSRAMSLPLIISSLTILKGVLYAPVSTLEARFRARRNGEISKKS